MSKPKRPLRILVTAGPTQEPLDPVRFISNRATGFLGYQLAKEARARGHRVILISGPTSLPRPRGAKFIPVETALEMKQAVKRNLKGVDCVIMSAAVCDFKPAKKALRKLKKEGKKALSIKLRRNSDILEELSRAPGNRILVGYALESDSLLRNARVKLKKKGLDIIVANKVAPGQGPFGPGNTDVTFIDKAGNVKGLRRSNKGVISRKLLDKVAILW